MEKTISEYDNSTESSEEKVKFQWKIPSDNSNGILFNIKWMEGILYNVVWHNKGDYFATLSKNTLGKTQVKYT